MKSAASSTMVVRMIPMFGKSMHRSRIVLPEFAGAGTAITAAAKRTAAPPSMQWQIRSSLRQKLPTMTFSEPNDVGDEFID
jgi:hypothetical protein